MNTTSILATLLVAGALALVAAFLFASTFALARWRGGWRLAAIVPLAGVAFVGARIVLDTRRDPTSHNLWPLELLITSVLGLVAITLLFVAQRVATVRRTAA